MAERDESTAPDESSPEQPTEAASPEPAVEVVEPDPQADYVSSEAETIARLRAQLDEQSARLRTVSKAYTELQTEMDAFRKRQQVLADARAEKKAGEVVERFFEPVQNLKRALDAEGSADDLRTGVRLVLQQFAKQLDELGLTEIPGVGSAFDPKLHDALAMMPVTDPAQDGKIIEVYSTGWRVGDRVIQPAQVVIGSYQAPAEA